MYKEEVGRINGTRGTRNRKSQFRRVLSASHVVNQIGHSWDAMGHGGKVPTAAIQLTCQALSQFASSSHVALFRPFVIQREPPLPPIPSANARRHAVTSPTSMRRRASGSCESATCLPIISKRRFGRQAIGFRVTVYLTPILARIGL